MTMKEKNITGLDKMIGAGTPGSGDTATLFGMSMHDIGGYFEY